MKKLKKFEFIEKNVSNNSSISFLPKYLLSQNDLNSIQGGFGADCGTNSCSANRAGCSPGNTGSCGMNTGGCDANKNTCNVSNAAGCGSNQVGCDWTNVSHCYSDSSSCFYSNMNTNCTSKSCDSNGL